MTQVIYEVNVEVDKDTTEAYRKWLTPHIEHILKIPGFTKATVFTRLPQEENKPATERDLLTVQYLVQSRQDLESYFQLHAAQLRQDGINTFGSKFAATRRILYVTESF